MTYTDGSLQTVTADSTGAYSLTVSSGFSGTVTPSKTGYTFSPVSKPYTNVLSDLSGEDYTATPITFKISGNAGVGGATLSYVDGTAKTATSDVTTGDYFFFVSYNWSGTVTPSKPGSVFSPPSLSYSNVLADIGGQNYTITASCSASPVPAGTVLINEVGWAGTSASTADKWVELHNTNPSCPVNLYGWHLYGQTSSSSFTITFVSTDTIKPAGDSQSADYFVIVTHAGTFNTTVRENKADSALNLVTYGQTLYLRGPSGELVDSANCYDTTCNGHASAYWPAGVSYPPTSMERYYNPPSSTQDVPEDWVTYGGSTALGDPHHPQQDRNNNVVRGTPGGPNWAASNAPTAVPPTEKVRRPTPIPPTPFAHMVINEFLPRAGTDWNRDGAINVYDEFIEVKNLGPISVNLSGWRLDDAANPPDSYTLPSMTLKSAERALFYRSTTNIPLEDSGGTVRLTNPSGIIFDARSYGPVAKPDVSHCRIPDGYYWQDACFPTPGTENSLTGSAAAAPPIAAVLPPPCLLPDTAPEAFRLGECAPYGSDIWDRTFWDDPAGNLEFLVQDLLSKWKTIVQ